MGSNAEVGFGYAEVTSGRSVMEFLEKLGAKVVCLGNAKATVLFIGMGEVEEIVMDCEGGEIRLSVCGFFRSWLIMRENVLSSTYEWRSFDRNVGGRAGFVVEIVRTEGVKGERVSHISSSTPLSSSKRDQVFQWP